MGVVSVFLPVLREPFRLLMEKVELVSEKFYDGLGACLGEFPQGAIIIEERAAEEFDEEAAKHHLKHTEQITDKIYCDCPSTMVTQFKNKEVTGVALGESIDQQSMLSQWPVQLTLVPPTAPFLQGTDLVPAADCVPFAYANFHCDILRNHSLIGSLSKIG